MRNITIVGAGQSGLQLGLGLLQNGYRVRLISNRTAEDLAAGKGDVEPIHVQRLAAG
jgi:2-polyprenyl-6-methoxyphenol hydroxylase-like FAD-dependent oxidoreductase